MELNRPVKAAVPSPELRTSVGINSHVYTKILLKPTETNAFANIVVTVLAVPNPESQINTNFT